jgi:FixJ family two-component response regulator
MDRKTKPGSREILTLIYVVDDNPAIREVIQVLMNSVNLDVQTFTSGEEFLSLVDDSASGCLLLDVRMPGMSGLEVQDAMNQRGIHLPIIFLTGHGEVPVAVQAMRGGALDFIEKPFQPQLLLDRVHACLKLNEQTRSQKSRKLAAENRLGQLTPREVEIAQMIVAGKPSKKIAEALDISEKTVDVHRFNIMKKVAVRSVAELVKLWLDATQEVA